MFKKYLLLILIFFSGFFSWNYINNNDFLLKNQNTLLNFFDHNKFHFDFNLDLENHLIKSVFNSSYQVSGNADIYYLNNNLAGFVNLGFDYLKFQQLNFSFLVNDNDLFFRITNNTFGSDLNFEFLDLKNWQRISLDKLSLDFSRLDPLTYLAVDDYSGDQLRFTASKQLLSEYDFLKNVEFVMSDDLISSNSKSFIDFDVSASKFSGQLPINKPKIFTEFQDNLLEF